MKRLLALACAYSGAVTLSACSQDDGPLLDAEGGASSGGGGFVASGGGPTVASGGSGVGGAATGGTGGGAVELPPCSPPSDLKIDDIFVSQAVHTPIVVDGEWLPTDERVVPLVGDRKSLFQATWTLDPAFVPRPIKGRLTLTLADGTKTVLASTITPAGEADLGTLESAFSFIAEAEAVAGDVSLLVELCEVGRTSPTTAVAGTRVPEAGPGQPLEVWTNPMPLKVMIVPMSTTCAAAPVIGVAEKRIIEDYIYNLFPANELEVRYHAPVAITDDCGEGNAMDVLAELRRNESLGPEWYYQGHFSNYADTSAGGYAWLFEDDESADEDRVGWVQYWQGEQPMNVTHELGHNHGSDHTFSASATPPYVPAEGKDLGLRPDYGFAVRGESYPGLVGTVEHRIFRPTIDSEGNQIENPGRNNDLFDVMSYEQPYWVSSFTYSEWARRIRASNGWSSAGPHGPRRDLVRLSLGLDGVARASVSRRDPVTLHTPVLLTSSHASVRTRARLVRGCDGRTGALWLDPADVSFEASGSLHVSIEGEEPRSFRLAPAF